MIAYIYCKVLVTNKKRKLIRLYFKSGFSVLVFSCRHTDCTERVAPSPAHLEERVLVGFLGCALYVPDGHHGIHFLQIDEAFTVGVFLTVIIA